MSSARKRLARLCDQLPPAGQEQLLAFAEFLVQRLPESAPAKLERPRPTTRPEGESVVAAIKRLSASYFMLDKAKVLNEASALMAQHLLHGRESVEVIDELEVLFDKQYRVFESQHREKT